MSQVWVYKYNENEVNHGQIIDAAELQKYLAEGWKETPQNEAEKLTQPETVANVADVAVAEPEKKKAKKDESERVHS